MVFRVLLCSLLLSPGLVLAHGSIVDEGDICVINIGFYKAHFKIYVPEKARHTQYCEDIPENGNSIFVMEYLHDGLADTLLDFRIIRNTTDKGRFTRLADIQGIDDIESLTVFYQQPGLVPDIFTVRHVFEENGEYVGVVTAQQPGTDNIYTAVFPFEVGYTDYGYWPWIITLFVLLQLGFWLMGRRVWQRQRMHPPKLKVVP